jgi:hypothetical protein
VHTDTQGGVNDTESYKQVQSCLLVQSGVSCEDSNNSCNKSSTSCSCSVIWVLPAVPIPCKWTQLEVHPPCICVYLQTRVMEPLFDSTQPCFTHPICVYDVSHTVCMCGCV